MKPDNVSVTDHAREKVADISERDGCPDIDVGWVVGRVMNADGYVHRDGDGNNYELYCPDVGGIGIRYAIEIKSMNKRAVVITVIDVDRPYHRYHPSKGWRYVDA